MLRAVSQLTRPCEGETANGDVAVVVERDGASLVALVDALGHGERAGRVAAVAAEHLAAVALDGGVQAVLDGLHAALQGTRGVAVTALLVRGRRVEAAGVGNVQLRTRGLSLPFVGSPGVVGVRVRKVRVAAGELEGPARVVLHSDGVSSRFDVSTVESLDAEHACRELFAAHARGHDDATLVVVDL